MAHHEFRETHTTTAGGVFATANSVDILSFHQPNAAYQKVTVNAIANLASATAHDRWYVVTLTATVATFTTKLASINAKLMKDSVETNNITATFGELYRTTPKPRGSC